MHLTEEMYLLLLRGVLAPSQLMEAAHGHAVERCERCREEWRRFLAGGEGAGLESVEPQDVPVVPPLRRRVTVPALPEDDDALSVADIDRWKELVSRMRCETRKAREDVGQLIELPADEWEGRVERGATRFRSRSFAQHLLTRSRRQVRDDPRAAARLAALVPLVLRWLPGADEEPWGVALRVRAEAYQANAERVAGDLPRALRLFSILRRHLEDGLAVDESVLAEVDSLEASLCFDQRRFEDAERLLDRAAARASRCGHRQLLCRVLIQKGMLQWTRGRAESALTVLETATAEMDPDEQGYDRACLVGNRAMALCQLERYDEATRLLDESEPLLRPRRHSAAYVSGIRGRLALARERWAEAATSFRDARSILLELGRAYDAALASLDLAHAHLMAGDTAALRDLATGLVPMFEARDVGRETLAVLRLLVEAVIQDQASTALLGTLRRRLQTVPG